MAMSIGIGKRDGIFIRRPNMKVRPKIAEKTYGTTTPQRKSHLRALNTAWAGPTTTMGSGSTVRMGGSGPPFVTDDRGTASLLNSFSFRNSLHDDREIVLAAARSDGSSALQHASTCQALRTQECNEREHSTHHRKGGTSRGTSRLRTRQREASLGNAAQFLRD